VKQKILIVDDDPDIRELLALRLRSHGYETAFAADAVLALNVLRSEQPDLVLLDVGLPGGEGMVVMERMKLFPALAHVPVFVVTARDPATTKERALEAGARRFFEKPIDQAELLDAIRGAIGDAAT